MATIRITDLSLRTVIGTYDWERKVKQDVLINVTMECDLSRAAETDDIKDTVDYKTITKKIIKFVEGSKFQLIEKLAGEILKLVLEDPRIEAATVRVDKPQALRFSRTVSVEMSLRREDRLNTVVIGLGSNIEPEENTAKARKILAERFEVLQESTFVRTKPIGGRSQPDFLNGAVKIRTPLTVVKLKSALKAIELELGRSSDAGPWDPRTIDLDILIFNGEVLDQDFYDRSFTRKSVLEVMPGWRP